MQVYLGKRAPGRGERSRGRGVPPGRDGCLAMGEWKGVRAAVLFCSLVEHRGAATGLGESGKGSLNLIYNNSANLVKGVCFFGGEVFVFKRVTRSDRQTILLMCGKRIEESEGGS